MKQITVSLKINTSPYIFADKTFYVVSQKGTKKYNIGQHFDLAQFRICVEQGIKVIVKP